MSNNNTASTTIAGVACTEKGVAVYGRVPKPHIKDPNEVLVRVHAAGINPIDWKVRDFNFFNLALPYTMGHDFSGVIIAVGSNVSEYKVGDEVFGNIEYSRPGSFAEEAVVNKNYIAHKPIKFTHLQAASLPVAALSAFEGIVTEAKLAANETIYIAGGAGGVGHFGVLFAKAIGARVISSASKPESLALLKKLGVDVIIDYSKQNVAEAVLAATNGQGADVVYDGTYPSDWVPSAKSVRKGGRFAYLGATQPTVSEAAAKIIKDNNVQLFEADLLRWTFDLKAQAKERMAGQLKQIAEWADTGGFAPVIDKVFKLEETPKALDLMKKSAFAGKAVVKLV